MSKQKREVRDRLERLKAHGIVLPGQQDQRQLWLLVRKDPSDTSPGVFFITHGRNYEKFRKRPGFKVLGHSFDKEALQAARRRAEDVCGPNYRPLVSARTLSPNLKSERELSDLDEGVGLPQSSPEDVISIPTQEEPDDGL